MNIRLFCLENAVKFNGKANPGAVIGKLIAEKPEIKSRMKEISQEVKKAISEVNKLSLEQQKKELLKLNPDFEKQEKAKKTERQKERSNLPPLQGAKAGEVITRMPPGPSKYLHVGHAISFGINWLYAQRYKGKCILRFDDTNPEVEKQEFVDAIKEDVIDYLGFRPTKTVFASDYIEKFYMMIDNLIEKDQAYACNCSSEDISKARREMKPCRHRKLARSEIKALWEDMKKAKNDYTIRLKIDMQHKNAVMRDPVIMRVVKAKHYRQGTKYKVWPMYDFESAVVDGLNNITHVMRSNEFDSRIELHNHIARILGFNEIPYKHYGRSAITGALTKGREIRQKIESKEYIGWDDPRLVTLKALRRRGIVKEALINLARRAGLSKSNTNIDFTVISTENRRILDSKASRYFFIQKQKKISVTGAPKLTNVLNLHPENRKGGRPLITNENFFVEESDYKKIKQNAVSRLMDCLNFTKKGTKIVFHSKEYEKFKGTGKLIIHWLPADAKNIKVKIFMPDAKYIEGIAEPNIKSVKPGQVIQFERFGFCRLDRIEKSTYIFWFTHD